jgi:hypothetical protein
MTWEQGMFCPCLNEGRSDYTCPSCGGKGYKYIRPTEIRALVTSINGHKEQEKIGLYDMGSAYLTPKSTDKVGFRDRFTFLDFTTKFSEVITKGASGEPDTLRYPAIGVLALFSLTDEYLVGQDFNLSEDGRSIEWIIEPLDEGEKYSVLYTMLPVYIAINPVHELRGTYTTYRAGGIERFVSLPSQYQIKREDFLDDTFLQN